MKRGRVIAQIKTADGKPILKDTPKSNFLKIYFLYRMGIVESNWKYYSSI